MPSDNDQSVMPTAPVGDLRERWSVRLHQTPSAADQDVSRDSFGQPILAQDQNIQADTTPLPQFQNGMLTGVNEQSVAQLQAQAAVQTPVNQAQMNENPVGAPQELAADKAGEAGGNLAVRPAKMPAGESKTSGVIAAILCVIVAIGLGLAVYALWSRLNVQIVEYRRRAEEWSQEVQALRLQLTGCQEHQQVAEATLPIFVEPNGYYSIYKEIPSLSVTADQNRAQFFYGETNGQDPISGFVMTIEVGETNGRSLEAIVNEDYTHAPNGVTNVGLRDEKIAEHIGFSYVAYQNSVETQHYYLQDSAPSKRYVKISYRVGASTDSEYDYYNRMAIRLMALLQLYELD